jgi:hypothetical protein
MSFARSRVNIGRGGVRFNRSFGYTFPPPDLAVLVHIGTHRRLETMTQISMEI